MTVDPTSFGEMISGLVIAHAEHGGWYDSPEGLRCAADDELVTPAPEWLEDS